jgi:NADPH-dependent F420 reductase
MPLTGKTIAVLGGTGAEGSGLAFRWAHAGLTVVIGSREAEKAQAAAAELNALLGKTAIVGLDNKAAAARGDIIVLTVPYAAETATALSVMDHLAGKVFIDVTVPLVPPKVDRVQLPGGRSAVEQLAEKLGPDVSVVAAFQNVGAHHLKDLAQTIECDVLVCGDSRPARDAAVALAEAAGLVGIHAGALVNAAAVEAMTSVLIAINKAYKAKASGIRITGLPSRASGGGGVRTSGGGEAS